MSSEKVQRELGPVQQNLDTIPTTFSKFAKYVRPAEQSEHHGSELDTLSVGLQIAGW